MTALVWDNVGEKIYEAGIDRGVIYKSGEITPTVWNGLTSVEEAPDSELKEFYIDGAKYLQVLTPGDFKGKIQAYTYPDTLESLTGALTPGDPGLTFFEQKPRSFSMTYRTLIGNDEDGTGHGYKLHILYNILAQPDGHTYETLEEGNLGAVEFGWNITGTPVQMPGMRPTMHIELDSTKTDPEVLQAIEDALYGTETTDPRLPSLIEVAGMFGFLGALTITDNGDGTWTATDLGDEFFTGFITMLDEVEQLFQIDAESAVFLDADSYTISSMAAGWAP